MAPQTTSETRTKVGRVTYISVSSAALASSLKALCCIQQTCTAVVEVRPYIVGCETSGRFNTRIGKTPDNTGTCHCGGESNLLGKNSSFIRAVLDDGDRGGGGGGGGA